MHGGCHCCHSETVSFVFSLLSCDVPCECSISEGLAIVPLTRHRFRTKSRAIFNGSLHAWNACLHENILASENPETRQAYSSAFSSKMWYSRVICVLLLWGLTLKGPGGGRNPPPPSTFRAINSRNCFSAPRAFMTFFFQVLRNFCRYFRKIRASSSKVMQYYVIERRLKIWKFSGFVYKTYGKWLLVPKLHFEL